MDEKPSPPTRKALERLIIDLRRSTVDRRPSRVALPPGKSPSENRIPIELHEALEAAITALKMAIDRQAMAVATIQHTNILIADGIDVHDGIDAVVTDLLTRTLLNADPAPSKPEIAR